MFRVTSDVCIPNPKPPKPQTQAGPASTRTSRPRLAFKRYPFVFQVRSSVNSERVPPPRPPPSMATLTETFAKVLGCVHLHMCVYIYIYVCIFFIYIYVCVYILYLSVHLFINQVHIHMYVDRVTALRKPSLLPTDPSAPQSPDLKPPGNLLDAQLTCQVEAWQARIKVLQKESSGPGIHLLWFCVSRLRVLGSGLGL